MTSSSCSWASFFAVSWLTYGVKTMKRISLPINRRITVNDLKVGSIVRKDIVTKIEQGYVFTQEHGEEILLGIIPHVLGNVNKGKAAFGAVEWEVGDRFRMEHREEWVILEITPQAIIFQTPKRVKVVDNLEFEAMLSYVLEPLL